MEQSAMVAILVGTPVAPRFKLRNFLYLNSEVVDQYLAQAEGGLFDEEAQASMGRSDRGAGLSVDAGPVSASGGGGSSDEEARSRLVRQTQESAFSRLASLLDQNDAVQWLESLDTGIWDQLERGEVLEVECHIEVPPVFKFLMLASQMEAMTDLMDSVGERFDRETKEGMQTLLAIGGLMQAVPLVASVAGSPDFKLVAPIDPSYLRVGLDELEGGARLYCALDRKLQEGEQFSIIDVIPAVRNLPNRDEMEKELAENEEFAGKPVEPPAAVVTAIAVFR